MAIGFGDVSDMLVRYWMSATPGDYAWLAMGVAVVGWSLARAARRPA